MPPNGTAGLARTCVRGISRLPSPPARTIARTRGAVMARTIESVLDLHHRYGRLDPHIETEPHRFGARRPRDGVQYARGPAHPRVPATRLRWGGGARGRALGGARPAERGAGALLRRPAQRGTRDARAPPGDRLPGAAVPAGGELGTGHLRRGPGH